MMDGLLMYAAIILPPISPLIAVTVISYRMGRRSVWLAIPWVLIVVFGGLSYSWVRSSYASLELPGLVSTVTAMGSSYALIVFLIALAIVGVRRIRPGAEVF